MVVAINRRASLPSGLGLTGPHRGGYYRLSALSVLINYRTLLNLPICHSAGEWLWVIRLVMCAGCYPPFCWASPAQSLSYSLLHSGLESEQSSWRFSCRKMVKYRKYIENNSRLRVHSRDVIPVDLSLESFLSVSACHLFST